MGLQEFFQRVAGTVDRAYERRIRAASMVTEYHPGGHHEHHADAANHDHHDQHPPEAAESVGRADAGAAHNPQQ